MLNAILPLPAEILLNDIAISGAQVPNAITVSAITILGIFKLFATEHAASTKISENLTIKIKPIINNAKTMYRVAKEINSNDRKNNNTSINNSNNSNDASSNNVSNNSDDINKPNFFI